MKQTFQLFLLLIRATLYWVEKKWAMIFLPYASQLYTTENQRSACETKYKVTNWIGLNIKLLELFCNTVDIWISTHETSLWIGVLTLMAKKVK